MRKVQYIDKEEMELAKSLEAEEWVSDLTKDDEKMFLKTIIPNSKATKKYSGGKR